MPAKKTPDRESSHLTDLKTSIASEKRACDLERRIASEHTESLLDEALAETFPASDPIAITSHESGAR